MKRFWLKITGLAIFVIAAVIGIYFFWPAELSDEGWIQHQDAGTSAVQPSIDNPQPKRQLEPQDFQPTATPRLQDQKAGIGKAPAGIELLRGNT